jgi:hypothetical protein
MVKSNKIIKDQFLVFFAVMTLVLSSCSAREEHFSVADTVDINFESVFNQMLNDTFYFPKVFGDKHLVFDEQRNAYSASFIRRGKQFGNRVWDLETHFKYYSYHDFGLSESQLKDFNEFHDNHFGDVVKWGEKVDCLEDNIEFRFAIPRVFTKNFENWYLVINYVIVNFSEDFVDFKSYDDLYNLNSFQDDTHFLRGNFYSYLNASCDSITLNYPVIFKWNNQKLSWELRNSKDMFEADIKELGFETIHMN